MNDNTKLFRHQTTGSQAGVHRANAKRYMPGLDGLRALSVLAVIAYHLNLKWAQGGLLGVGIFFVISGYLITDQIITEWNRHQRLSLVDFWIRRARRLLPAMIGMLLFVAAWLYFVDSSRLHALQGDFLSSLFYINNWWLIFHQVSYFESFGPPSPIGHLWSLSVEEQFYVMWPLLLVIGLKIASRRGTLALLILAGAALSAMAMAMIYVPGTDPSRVYYGTDTRAFALLTGAALAVVWPSQKMNDRVSTAARNTLDIAGGIGILALILFIYQTVEYDDWLYRGGLLFLSLIAAAVIAVLSHPASRVGKIMGCKPLRWLGVRSYSLYIWHYPVIILTSPDANTDDAGVTRIILQLAASLILAAFSYRYIEEPFRRGRVHLHWKMSYSPLRRRVLPVILAAILPAFLIPSACSISQSKEGLPAHVVETAGSQNGSKQPETPSTVQDTKHPEARKPASAAQDTAHPEAQTLVPPDIIESGKGITAIGDSVILDAKPFLAKMLPGIAVDGKVGRQMRQAQDAIDQLKAQGKLGDRIIIELGTNGAFSKKQLRALLHSLSDAKQVVLVNTRVPRNWQDTVNATIAEVSNEFNNTAIVDWYSASEGKGEYFYRDGVHLNRDGAEYYASILAKAVAQTF
ncbi:acyltransferase family protein [Brevibacillus panacihumi]|uniref:Acetyltransferase n=1 Tax=Brevibacillus panacihumi TaxID=497735 RepID=A0A3M8DEC2_9BACL|nr:acetyltransferase [Brevibacillus panacihumi]